MLQDWGKNKVLSISLIFGLFWASHFLGFASRYCSSYPNFTSSRGAVGSSGSSGSVFNNKCYFGILLQTRALPCFTEFHTWLSDFMLMVLRLFLKIYIIC